MLLKICISTVNFALNLHNVDNVSETREKHDLNYKVIEVFFSSFPCWNIFLYNTLFLVLILAFIHVTMTFYASKSTQYYVTS